MRKVVPMRVSSSCAVCSLSRRHSAETSPSIAEAATPASEVPNASPRPLTGAASEARMADTSDALSSAMPVPLSVTTMPTKVPSMPSSTSNPARYGVRAGPGSPVRSPSMRRRTAFRREGCRAPSH